MNAQKRPPKLRRLEIDYKLSTVYAWHSDSPIIPVRKGEGTIRDTYLRLTRIWLSKIPGIQISVKVFLVIYTRIICEFANYLYAKGTSLDWVANTKNKRFQNQVSHSLDSD